MTRNDLRRKNERLRDQIAQVVEKDLELRGVTETCASIVVQRSIMSMTEHSAIRNPARPPRASSHLIKEIHLLEGGQVLRTQVRPSHR
jgi:hypothetical protein